MISEEKIKKIKKSLRNGVPEGEIKETLKREGYSTEDISKIFVPHKYDMRSWYLTFAIGLALIGLLSLLENGSLLLLILAALLFLSYFREIERLKK
ncbi:MAG TPA: hypothetical protein VK498_06870 [Ferruginibacter sp.]|nr:hypothetical protein [Ferruginibacter sp.]